MLQQAQNQNQDQAIQLSKSGKSYRYQGRSYFLKKEYYRFDTHDWFWEKCYHMHKFQQEIQLKLNEAINKRLSPHIQTLWNAVFVEWELVE